MVNKNIVIDALSTKTNYRDSLELSPLTKFGLEIEMDHLSLNKIILDNPIDFVSQYVSNA